MTTNLNDIQNLLLTTAATRDDGSLLPVPDMLAALDADVRKAVGGLLRRKFVKEIAGTTPDRVWRRKSGEGFGLAITATGRAAIGNDKAGSDAAPGASGDMGDTTGEDIVGPAPAPVTKAAHVLALLQRPEGVTLDVLVATTGWQPHTTRAALTGLRKKGHVITRTSSDAGSCYRIVRAA